MSGWELVKGSQFTFQSNNNNNDNDNHNGNASCDGFGDHHRQHACSTPKQAQAIFAHSGCQRRTWKQWKDGRGGIHTHTQDALCQRFQELMQHTSYRGFPCEQPR
mmetsp:Transcript_44067/g.94999  ORF Transcript_44067/g.94999 Transcript_44067/m.94999 type:complete len:105 (+) Transcript_44067:279-593(+)